MRSQEEPGGARRELGGARRSKGEPGREEPGMKQQEIDERARRQEEPQLWDDNGGRQQDVGARGGASACCGCFKDLRRLQQEYL